jgi:hypothetical protein
MHAVTNPCRTLLDLDMDALAAHDVLQVCIVFLGMQFD